MLLSNIITEKYFNIILNQNNVNFGVTRQLVLKATPIWGTRGYSVPEKCEVNVCLREVVFGNGPRLPADERGGI